MAIGMIPKRVPWTHQPPYYVERFDKGNFFGNHCIWAVVPGWGDPSATGTDDAAGHVYSVGQNQKFTASTMQDIDGGKSLKIVPRSYPKGIGICRTMELEAFNDARGYRLLRTDDDIGIVFPNTAQFTILAIVRPKGDGTAGNQSDSRIYSKDLGAGANDHDLMIGLVRSSGTKTRARIRIGTATVTVVGGQVVENDSLNLIAGIVSDNTVIIRLLREDGTHNRVTGSGTGSYNPRTTTDMAIGANAGADNNAFEGDIICVYAFDIMLDTDDYMEKIMANPWQVFEPQTRFIPTEVADAAGFTSQLMLMGLGS